RTPTRLRRPTAEGDERRAVEVGGGDGADAVGDARARGEHGDAGSASELGRALGGPRRRLLVTHVDDAPSRFHCSVVDGEDVAGRKGEDLVHAVPGEGRDEQLSAVAFHRQWTSWRNDAKASHHASVFSNWGECPASGITARLARGMALAMRSEG